ncbi:MAG TPA: T9SS type A sorting domain-containing protein, partial [Panacibacter sp.]|nr:T9SS type A sorting domain-containing protein [Panacibacter sp.]
QWQTASEQNSAGFTVEYAADGVTFSSIGTIKAAGNSNSMKSYSFIHSKPKNGSNFYRLRIINTDAKTSISKTISVNLSNINTMLSVYPNPAKEYMVVDHPATANDARLTLVDMNGRMIKTIKVIKDAVQTTINIKSVLPGSYKIVWNDGITTRNQTVVVK